jgi:hypothetical protein
MLVARAKSFKTMEWGAEAMNFVITDTPELQWSEP